MAQLLPATSVFAFVVTVAANTPSSSPSTTTTGFGGGKVTRVEVDVPAGHGYLTGVRFVFAGGQVIPQGRGSWITTDNAHLAWDMATLLDADSWQVVAYNTGQFQHSFYCRFSVYAEEALGESEPSPVIVQQPSPVVV
jgi:hypothetical protein